MNSLFGDLGIFSGMMPVMDEKEKQPKKKTEKKEGSSKPVKKLEEQKYKAPLKILFDSTSLIELNDDKEYTDTDLFKEIDKIKNLNIFEKYKDQFSLKKIKADTYLIRPSNQAKYEKGDSGNKILLEDVKELALLFGDTEEKITAETVKEKLKELYKVDVDLYLIEDTYIPIPVNNKKNSENIKYPLRITALTMYGQILEFTKDDCEEFYESEEEQESLLPVSENEDSNVSKDVLVKILKSFFPDYADDLSFTYDENENVIQVMHKRGEEAALDPKTATKKEETYPTNATLSLIFTKYELSPDMFSGKKEVTKKEILNYIRKLGYIEYSPERTEIRYEKKENLIIPLIKSAKRGYYLDDNEAYRKEDTELMYICASKNENTENNKLIYHLPKVPFHLFKEIIYFFWDVYVFKGTEAAVQLYYNKKDNEYEIYIPEQEVTKTHVTFKRDIRRETDSNLILAAEIHSHGNYGAFWSAEDDREEVAHRIYGVIGDLKSFSYDKKHIKVRGATGGYHVVVNPNEIFEFPLKICDFHCAMDKITFR